MAQAHSVQPAGQPSSAAVPEAQRAAEKLLPACWKWQTELRPAERQAVAQSEPLEQPEPPPEEALAAQAL